MDFKELTTTEKVEHIWEYYKFPIMAILGTLIIVILISTSVYKNLNTDIVLDVTFMTTVFDVAESEELQNILNDRFVNLDAKKEEKVLIEHINVSTNLGPDQVTAYKAKLFGKSSSKMLDLLVVEETAFAEYAEAGMFLPLDDLISNGTIQADEESLVYSKTEDDESEGIYGIKINNSLINKITGDNNSILLAVFADNINQENTIASLKLLLEN